MNPLAQLFAAIVQNYNPKSLVAFAEKSLLETYAGPTLDQAFLNSAIPGRFGTFVITKQLSQLADALILVDLARKETSTAQTRYNSAQFAFDKIDWEFDASGYDKSRYFTQEHPAYNLKRWHIFSKTSADVHKSLFKIALHHEDQMIDQAVQIFAKLSHSVRHANQWPEGYFDEPALYDALSQTCTLFNSILEPAPQVAPAPEQINVDAANRA